MKQAQNTDTLWTHRTILGGVDVPTMHTDRYPIRLKYDVSDEEYRHREELLFPLTSRSGRRIYFGAKPYILTPEITLTFALMPPKADSAEIGKVIDSDIKQYSQK